MLNYFKISKFLIYLVPLVVAIVTNGTLFPFIVGKYVAFRFLVGFSLIFFLLGLLFHKESSVIGHRLLVILKRPPVVALGVFVLAFVLAGFFGVDPSYSFWSNFERGEGSIQLIFLFAFALMLLVHLRDKNDWRKFFWISILGAYLMIFYGIGAGLKYVDADYRTAVIDGVEQEVLAGTGGPLFQTFHGFIGSTLSDRFAGSVGNPAYVATYLMFAAFFAAYLLHSYRGKKHRMAQVFLISSLLVFALFFFLAATRGAFLGVGVGALAALGYLIYASPKFRKPLLSIVLVLVVLASLGFYFKDSPAVKRIPGSRIFDISLKEQTLQHRMIMWGIAFEGWKDRPLFGWGPENYPQVFYRHYNPAYFDPAAGTFGAWFDRAHNIFFDYLVETGIIGLLAYVAIFVTYYMQFFRMYLPKSPPALLSALFLAMPLAYIVQGMVLFEVLVIYLPLFSFLAFASYTFNEEKR